MIKTNVFTVYGYDKINYREIGTLLGVFLKEQDAKIAAQYQGYSGSNGTVVERQAVIDEDYVYLIDSQHPNPIRANINLKNEFSEKKKAALAKLSVEDLTVLGFKD